MPRHPLRPPPEAIRTFPSGPESAAGLRIPFFLSEDGLQVEAEWTATSLLEGWNGLLHGSAFAALHDEAAIYAMVALGGECGFTTDLSVKFLAPLRIGDLVRIRGRVQTRDARTVTLATEILLGDRVVSTAAVVYAVAAPALVARMVGGTLSPYLAEFLAATPDERKRLARAWGDGTYAPRAGSKAA